MPARNVRRSITGSVRVLDPAESRIVLEERNLVLQSADAFRAASRPFCEKVAKLRISEAVEEGRRDLGGMIASATNLAFAVELYMKALRIVNKQGPKWTHNLGKLYSDLPEKLRRSIEVTYEAAPKPDVSLYATSLGISITHKDASAEERATIPRGPSDESILAVLERSSAVFENWRYLYDQGEPGRVKRLPFEYHYLGIAADALREHVVRGLREEVVAK